MSENAALTQAPPAQPTASLPADVAVLVNEANAQNVIHIYDSISDNSKKQLFLAALSREFKVAVVTVLKARVSQQHAQNAETQAQQTQAQYPPPKLGYAFVRGGDNNQEPDELMDYIDDLVGDDLDDDYDNDLESFEQEIGNSESPSDAAGRRDGAAGTSGFSAADMERLAREFSNSATIDGGALNSIRVRKEIGDFELLRIAKMGDKESFCWFEKETNCDVRLLFDNNQRDALHYAVDSGNLDLVKYLVEERKMTLRRDEKMKATALEMSVLMGHDEIARYLSSRFPPNDVPTATEVQKFATPPPRFCLAKAAPIVAPEQRQRTFWTKESVEIVTTTGDTEFSTELLDGQSSAVATVFSVFLNRSASVEHRNLDVWTAPVSLRQIQELLPKCSLVGGVSAIASGVAHPAAIGATLPIGVTLVIASAAMRPQALALNSDHPVQLAGWLNVAPQYQHSARASQLLHFMLGHVAPSVITVFRCHERVPPQPLCLVKWFRRSVQTTRVFGHLQAASEVYADFFSYDEVLRVDHVAKEMLLPSKMTSPTLLSWQEVTAENRERVTVMILSSLRTLLEQNKAEVYVVPSVASFVETVFFSGDVKTFFIESAEGVLKDIVVVRMRESREKTSNDAGAPCALECCVVLFALFSPSDFPSGDAKLHELLLIAHRLGSSTIVASNTCGFTDSDFSKANFSEVESYREYLYAVSTPKSGEPSKTPTSVVGASATNASKVFIPFALM